MRVRWMGNSCVDIVGEERVVIDPHPTVELLGKADKILITHEHDDHFDPDTFEQISKDAEVYAPKHTLEKFDIQGIPVAPGDGFDDFEVLPCNCWKSEESVSYLYQGVLHTGDSAEFPDADLVKLAFTACFPDNYDDYLEGLSKIKPGIVVPFHYDPKEKMEEAEGLVKILEDEGLRCKILSPGEEIVL